MHVTKRIWTVVQMVPPLLLATRNESVPLLSCTKGQYPERGDLATLPADKQVSLMTFSVRPCPLKLSCAHLCHTKYWLCRYRWGDMSSESCQNQAHKVEGAIATTDTAAHSTTELGSSLVGTNTTPQTLTSKCGVTRYCGTTTRIALQKMAR